MQIKKFQSAALCATFTLIVSSVSAFATEQAAPAVPAATAAASRQEQTADKHVSEAVGVVQKMHAEPRMKELLQQAKGIFIVPTYGRAAVGVGASGGAGVLLVKRADGSWLVDGSAGIEDLVKQLDIKVDPLPRDYSTISGLVLAELERIPAAGDVVSWRGLRIEVVDMDGRRIDKLLVART